MLNRFLAACVILLTLFSAALADGVHWTSVPEDLRPGKSFKFVFSADADRADVCLEDDRMIREGIAVQDGQGSLWWDGTLEGEFLSPGTYSLVVSDGTAADSTQLQIGPPAPIIEDIEADEEITDNWEAHLTLNMAGTLTAYARNGSTRELVLSMAVDAGEVTVTQDMLEAEDLDLLQGDFELEFFLVDESDYVSGGESIDLSRHVPQLARDAEYHTPNERTGDLCTHDVCFWKMNMGDLNDEAVWEILTQPLTVLKGSEKDKLKIPAKPDESCTDYVGEVTCASQSVHILEQQGEWTRIQAYSSSEEGSRVAVWALPFEGWVKTDLLIEKPVSQTYGIVVDKLQQRLYLYKNGKLFSTLLCSTGYPREDTPFNETPAGEFGIVSWTGGFWSGEMYCDLALRINDGILLHEVPCFITTDANGQETRDYKRCETYLGEKASHGCIRIQRYSTPEGISMKWLWEHLNRKEVTKVIIWDEIGRELLYPDDDVTLYYNPDGGKQYHSSPTCRIVKEKYWPLKPFLYGELDEAPYASLTRCPGCAPQFRQSEIDTINKKNNRKVPR